MPLAEVFQKVFDTEKGGKAIDGKASGAELTAYVNKVLPDFDKERVHNSDLKKLVNWYNLLQENGLLIEVVEEKEVKKASKKKADATDEAGAEEKPKKAAKKTTAEKATAATKPKKDTATKAKSTSAPVRKTNTVRKTGA